jgi:hypothetical protein
MDEIDDTNYFRTLRTQEGVEEHDAFSCKLGERATWVIEPRITPMPGGVYRASVHLLREGAAEGRLFNCIGDYGTEDEARRRAVQYGQDWIAENPFE